jgi:hypothetical protein
MKLRLYQVDAFAERVFEGNPAAVCPLQAWLPDAVMQAIAEENNLSETAFFVREGLCCINLLSRGSSRCSSIKLRQRRCQLAC